MFVDIPSATYSCMCAKYAGMEEEGCAISRGLCQLSADKAESNSRELGTRPGTCAGQETRRAQMYRRVKDSEHLKIKYNYSCKALSTK